MNITAKNSEGYAAPIGVSADPVIFTLKKGKLHVLLVKRPEEPQKGFWALPGGFLGDAEEAHETVLRKLQEKTGMEARDVYLEQLRTYTRPDRDERGWLPAIAYLALVPSDLLPGEDTGGGGEQEAAWHPVAKLPKTAFDHAQMIQDGLERLRGKLWYSNVAVGLLPREFTLAEAREVYQAISSLTYDPGNFARDLKASKLIKSTNKKRAGSAGRPAATFKFTSRAPSAAKGRR